MLNFFLLYKYNEFRKKFNCPVWYFVVMVDQFSGLDTCANRMRKIVHTCDLQHACHFAHEKDWETSLIQNQVRYFHYVYNRVFSLSFQYVYNCVFSLFTSVEFNSKKVHEDEIFGQEDIYTIFLRSFQRLQICKIPKNEGTF